MRTPSTASTAPSGGSFPFTDVVAGTWYYGAAAYAYNNGLFAGMTPTTFAPNATMTRAMLVTVLLSLIHI